MGKKCKCEECVAGAPMWMSTFSDMMSLLLTFFVLLLSMASMDKKKIKQAIGSLQGALGVLEGGQKTEMGKEEIMSRMDFVDKMKQKVKTVSKSIKDYIQKAKLSSKVSVVKTEKGISIRIMDSVLFKPGGAVLEKGASPLLIKLAAVMKDSPYNILVEGHTDDIPINTAKFPSNWDLSSERAIAVVKFFLAEDIKPSKLAASGYAQYHPLVPNITPENRAKNRRVEVNFVSPEMAESGKNIFEDKEGGY